MSPSLVLALFPFVPLVGMLALAAALDLRDRRLPNWLTAAVAAAGLTGSFLPGAAVTPAGSALGLLAGGALLLLPFILGAVGGGDVKLLAGVGAWLGPLGALIVLLGACLAGMLLVLAQALAEGRLRDLGRNSLLLALNLSHVQQLGGEHVARTGESCRSVRRPLPFAVPVLAGTLTALALRLAGGAP